MSDKLNKARESLAEFAGRFAPKNVIEGTVKEINADSFTADVEIEKDVVYFDCRLKAVITDKKSIDVLPAIGSNVVMLKIADDDYLVLSSSEIKEYCITIEGTVYKIDETGHLISRQNETLKKVLTDLVDVILTIGAYKDTATLTLIKQRINGLLK